MRRPKCMSTIHRELAENRREANTANHDWAVYRLTKQGTQMKRPSATYATEQEATKAAESMTRLNPGMTFVSGPY